MSLDDRLRRGLQTLDEPAGDPARELERFRTSAYPRRARRRVLQAAVGTVAAAALIAGVTTAVTNSARKAPGFITPPPVNVPACRSDDVQPILTTNGLVVSGRSKAYYVTYEVISKGPACRIDETIAPTFTASTIEFPALHDGATAPLLPIQGNQSPDRLVGVVPAVSHYSSPAADEKYALSISWAWTNWCGGDRSFSVTFHRISGSTHVLNPEGSTATSPIVPTCDNKSAPSMLNVTPVTLGTFPHPISDDIDLNPHIIAPRAGLTNLSTVYVDQVVVEPDGKTLLVSLIHGDMCSLFARIDTKETARTVTLTGYVGDEPGGPTCPGGGHAGDAARIELKQPLGNRRIVDGTDPSLTVQVARRAGR